MVPRGVSGRGARTYHHSCTVELCLQQEHTLRLVNLTQLTRSNRENIYTVNAPISAHLPEKAYLSYQFLSVHLVVDSVIFSLQFITHHVFAHPKQHSPLGPSWAQLGPTLSQPGPIWNAAWDIQQCTKCPRICAEKICM